MQNSGIQRKPSYSLESVDNALHLLQVLRDTGSLRLKDAAAELGVAPSTAHRLLGMLVYRGFAVQDESRRYLPGPSMGVGPVGESSSMQLRRIISPHMELLAGRLGETVNLMIRVGTKVRFLTTVEGTGLLRVGDRQGAVLPAHLASGGKALLAELDSATLARLYRSDSANMSGDRISEEDYPGFLRELNTVRRNGFAANFEETEDGVSAVGVALHDGRGTAVAALTVATPVSRFRRLVKDGLVAVVLEVRAGIERDLAAGLEPGNGTTKYSI